MKKAFIIIDHFKIGGAERVASILANAMCDEWEVHAIVNDSTQNYPVDKRVKIHLLHGAKYSHFFRIITRIKEYRKLSRTIHPDVIFAFGNYSSVYAWQCKRSLNNETILIASERTDPTREPHNFISVWLRNIAYKYADYLVCQTIWVQKYFENKRISRHCVVIPNPISSNLPLWKGQTSKVIITACRLEEQKNLNLLIDAFAVFHKKNNGYELRIYGEGSLRNVLESHIADLGLEDCISMPGFSTNIMTEMSEARMYISTSDYEGISNSMLEAVAIGAPIVHTDCPVGGAAMYIKNGINGFLIPVGDKEAIVMSMQRIVDGEINASQLTASALSLRKELSSEKILKMWTNLVK